MKRTCRNCGHRQKKCGLMGSWCVRTLKDVKLNQSCSEHRTYNEKWGNLIKYQRRIRQCTKV